MIEYREEITINKFKIEFNAMESENQDEKKLFTKGHTIFDCSITISNAIANKEYGKIEFPYQCNLQYVEPSAIDCLDAVVSDAYAYLNSRNEADFLEEFGYLDSGESALKGIEAYNACKKTYEELIEILPGKENDLQQLSDDIYEKMENRDIEDPEM